ncbi:3-methylmercaptopropionyl-CoA dehydrogenase [Ruegeria pomeroyi]|uniref:3-methylmercaptopropionyl-CoA dehydrogenase n=1 Tax=Ruegeria pomeroyi TaxID=89184 RepID=A0A9Q3WQ37_9RHOB|nr:3-methylmercaptopropionyl-CoA dehydrogenase [Ruegeria pomeroyi]MCE8540054.1 3-methylmercaptopropionyl-CoA dehydrogenase [Ruegeria pomeroyi]
MTYQAPVRDIMFAIEHLSQWSQVEALQPYSEIELDDARAALEEFGRFCGEMIAPLSTIGDTEGARQENGRVVLPEGYKAAYDQFVEMGWQSLSHPTEHGGMGLPKVVGAAATEIVNSADMSFGLCPLLTNGAIDALSITGSEAQKAFYLDKLITGRWSGTMNLTEPQAGSDLSRVRCKAVPQDDGTYAISGTKIFITFGEHDLSENIVHLVLARTPNAPEGVRGLSLFVVPKLLEGEGGETALRNTLGCVSLEHKLGVRASPTAVMEYNNATGYLVGEENSGLRYMFIMMTSARYAVGVQGVAIAERAYQHALSYARDRVQSRPVDGSAQDAVPIIQHPDVRRMLLRMRALTEGGRALAIATGGWLDLAEHGPEAARAEAQSMAEFLVPLVKGFCTERAVEVASLGVQIHGGMGFIEETGVAQFYRDARILPIYEGTTAIQANDLLGRKVLRDGGRTARRFAEMIAATEGELSNGGAAAQRIAQRLAEARLAFTASLDHLLATAGQDPNRAYAGSVPFLMLTGNLATGWQLGLSALAAEAELAKGGDAEFLEAKIATADIFAQQVLVECSAEHSRITDTGDSLLTATL